MEIKLNGPKSKRKFTKVSKNYSLEPKKDILKCKMTDVELLMVNNNYNYNCNNNNYIINNFNI